MTRSVSGVYRLVLILREVLGPVPYTRGTVGLNGGGEVDFFCFKGL